jgi:hypothetical protein
LARTEARATSRQLPWKSLQPAVPVKRLNITIAAGPAFKVSQQTTKESKPCAAVRARCARRLQRFNLINPSAKDIRHLLGKSPLRVIHLMADFLASASLAMVE